MLYGKDYTTYPEAPYVLTLVITRIFIISIITFFSVGIRDYFFTLSAAELTTKLRMLSFRTILKQDSELISILAHNMHSSWISTILR